MITPLKLIGILWAIWLIGWFAAAPWSWRTVARQSLGNRLLHLAVIASGAALYFRHPWTPHRLDERLFPATAAVPWIGLALVVCGLGFSVWARVHLGRLWSGSVTLKAGHTIVKTGPYGITRHPIYTGMLLAALGTSLAIGTAAAAAGFVLLCVGFVIKSGQEERLLRGHFGEAYEEYRRHMRRLIPYVW